MPSLNIFKVADYEFEPVRNAVSNIFDRSNLGLSGKTVLVKPNLLGPWGPESAVVTHPSIVKAVKEELVSRGAKVIVGDNPGVRGYGKMMKTAEASGTLQAAGESFVNLSRKPHKQKTGSKYSEYFSICSEVLEADYFISLPKFKTHMNTVLTGAIKNSYGLLVGAEKSRLHSLAPKHADFGELVVDVYSVRPPDLVILDAVVGMEGNGPSAGNPRRIGYLLSSENGGAVDLAMCAISGIDPSRVPTIKPAFDKGLSPAAIDEVEVNGALPVLNRFKPPSGISRLDPWGIAQRTVFGRISTPRLSADEERCTKCATCEKVCPVGAVTIDNEFPKFDRSKCISCYCCHELCPESAVKIGRLLKRMRGFT